MRAILFSAIALTVATQGFSAFAGARQLTSKCATVAQEAAVKANKKQFNAETSGCGTKTLHVGGELETYLVCVSDETDPSEWIVTVKPKVTDGHGKVTGQCIVDYTGYAVDAATPDFE